MRRLLAIVAFVILSGCDLSDLPDPKRGETHERVNSSSDLVIGFGSLGEARVGMGKREALDTGLFDRKDFDPADKCRASALKFKKRFKDVEVRTDTVGTIRSLRILGPGPKTLLGVQVGSSLADVRAAYSASMTEPSKVGRANSGVYVRKNRAWIGFLFDKNPKKIDVVDNVTYIEVTDGQKPQLRHDC